MGVGLLNEATAPHGHSEMMRSLVSAGGDVGAVTAAMVANAEHFYKAMGRRPARRVASA